MSLPVSTRIAQVTAYWGPDYPTGSGVFCYELSRRLAERHQVDVFTSDRGSPARAPTGPNLRLHRLRTLCTIWGMNPLCNAFSGLMAGDYDIIHVHSYIFFLSNMAALARRMKPHAKLVLHFHGGLHFCRDARGAHRGRIWAKEHVYDPTLGRLTAGAADRVLSVARSDIPLIRKKFGRNEVGWVPTAVDTDLFHPGAPVNKPPVVAYVGKLERWKGIDTLVAIFRILHHKLPGVRFLVAGSGSLAGEVATCGLPVEILGAVPYAQMPDVYRRATALVLPSFVEGLPCALLEAQACGLPVVASDVGDCAKAMLPGVSGFICTPGDAGGMAARLEQLLMDESLCTRMGQQGRAFVSEHFSYEAVTRQVLGIYEDVIRNKTE